MRLRTLCTLMLAVTTTSCGAQTITPLPTASLTISTPSSTVGNTTIGHALPIAPLPTGTPEVGGSRPGVAWTPIADDGIEIVRVIPSGVESDLYQAFRARYISAPSVRTWQNLRADADVKLVKGAADNGIGIGCLSSDSNTMFAFLINDSGWAIEEFNGPDDTGLQPPTIASGTTSALLTTSGATNHLSVVCSQSSPGTQLMYAINRTPVANVTVSASAQYWAPAIAQCSCDGPTVADFTNMSDAAF